jgi:putative membrane protein
MKIQAIALAAALTLSASTATAFGQGFSDKDKSFLKESTEDNLAEIKMAELTVKTTKNPAIKAFAEQMIQDHKALIAGAKPVALKAGVTPPTTTSAKAEAEYLKLKVLTGETYDKSYVKTMVSDHHEDLDKVKAENTATTSSDMKKLTAHAASVISMHTEKIDSIAAKMGLQ